MMAMLVEIKITPSSGEQAGRYRSVVLDYAFGTEGVPECEVISILMAAVARIGLAAAPVPAAAK